MNAKPQHKARGLVVLATMIWLPCQLFTLGQTFPSISGENNSLGWLPQAIIEAYASAGPDGIVELEKALQLQPGSGLEFLEAMFAPCETNPPVITSVSADCVNNRVVVTFSEQVDPATAQDVANYSIGGVIVFAATNAPFGSNVTLSVSPLSSTNTYTISVSNVRDLCTNVLVPNPTSRMFSCQPEADLTGSWPATISRSCAYTAKLLPYVILKSPFIVTNQGSAPVSTTVVNFFFSDNDILDSSDILVQKATCRFLNPNQARQIAFRGKLPVCTPATNKFVIAVVNATLRAQESNTNNNQSVFGPIQ
jgi:hypothetical protein